MRKLEKKEERERNPDGTSFLVLGCFGGSEMLSVCFVLKNTPIIYPLLVSIILPYGSV